MLHLRPPVPEPQHRFAAGLEPPDRLGQQLRRFRDRQVFRVDGDLRAEAPTHVGGDRADPLSIDAEQLREVVADVERHLGRHPDGVTVSLGDDGDPVGLHRHRGEALVDEAPLDHDVGAGEDVLVPVVLEAVGDVRADRREQQRSAVLRGQLGIGHRVERVGRRRRSARRRPALVPRFPRSRPRRVRRRTAHDRGRAARDRRAGPALRREPRRCRRAAGQGAPGRPPCTRRPRPASSEPRPGPPPRRAAHGGRWSERRPPATLLRSGCSRDTCLPHEGTVGLRREGPGRRRSREGRRSRRTWSHSWREGNDANDPSAHRRNVSGPAAVHGGGSARPTTIAVAAPAAAAAVKVVPVKTGLNGPSGFTFSPNGKIWYLERATGEVRILNPKTGADHLFYKIASVNSAGERGALGIALDPSWPSAAVRLRLRHADLERRAPQPAGADPQRRRTRDPLPRPALATPPSASGYHNGGRIRFGPDHKLYVMIGDGHALIERAGPNEQPAGQDPAARPRRDGRGREPVRPDLVVRTPEFVRVHLRSRRPAVCGRPRTGPSATTRSTSSSEAGTTAGEPARTAAARPRGTRTTAARSPAIFPRPTSPTRSGSPAPRSVSRAVGSSVNGDLVFGDVNTGSIRAINMNASRTGFSGLVEGAAHAVDRRRALAGDRAEPPHLLQRAERDLPARRGLNGTFGGSRVRKRSGTLLVRGERPSPDGCSREVSR